MINAHRIAGLALAVTSVVLLDACHKKPTPVPEPVQAAPPPPAPNADSIRRAEEERARLAAEAAAKARADSIAAAEAAARRAAEEAAAAARAVLVAVVHFDFDKSDLRDEDRAILDSKIPVLQANPGVTLSIQGHTDDRGSDEYNLALGQRRATAVKKYLVDHGIADSRLVTVTFGEDRPVAQGEDEGAWAQNRRAEFEITAGDSNLRRP